jgi:guanylate kinase
LSERVPSLIVVSAPSGSGKSTVLARVLAELSGLRFSVSHTTRAARPGERDGVAYHFVDEASFEELIRADRFLEWARVHGDLKGTSWDEYEAARRDGADLLLDVDVQGAAQVRSRFRDALSVFLLPPSFEVLEARLRGRAQDDAQAIERRLTNAQREVARSSEYDYVVVNGDVAECVEAVKSIVRAARLRTRVAEAVVRAVLKTFPGERSSERT